MEGLRIKLSLHGDQTQQGELHSGPGNRAQIFIIPSDSVHLRQRTAECIGTHFTAQLSKSALQLFVRDVRRCGPQAFEQRLVMLRPLCVIHCLKCHQLLWRPEMANEKLAGIKIPDSRRDRIKSDDVLGYM